MSFDNPTVYGRLQGRSFRLLKYLDLSGLRYRLEEVELDNAPRYCGLSYVWHDPEAENSIRPTIEVNGLEVEIQPNLYNALSHIGRRCSRQYGRIWVDFLCINQSDLDERSTQVRLMRDIFETAQVTIAWLGLLEPNQLHLTCA